VNQSRGSAPLGDVLNIFVTKIGWSVSHQR
jgi:hypothetical protein